MSDQIEHVQKRAFRICCPDLDYEDALDYLKAESLKTRRTDRCKKFFNEMKQSDHKLNYMLPQKRSLNSLRVAKPYELPKTRTQRFKASPINYCLFNFQ